MAISEVLNADRRTLRVPFPASTAIAVGDLLWWDNSAKVAKRASARSDAGSKAANQADFTPLFLGLAADQRLAAETAVTGVAAVGPGDRLVVPEGIFDVDVPSGTYEFGTLLGVDRDSTPLNTNQQLITVTQAALAIGFVVKREPVATTKVRAFLSAYGFGWFRAQATPILGYQTGQGGAVTQLTSKSTGVTLSKLCGQITTHNASLGAGAEVAFTLTNTLIAATDVVVVSIASGGTSAAYGVSVTATAAGSCEITLSNLSAGALGEALVLNFVVIKAVAA